MNKFTLSNKFVILTTGKEVFMLREFEEKIKFLIEQNKENLLDSHLKYGGVYLAEIDMGNGETSLEIELDEGNIGFSLAVNPSLCPHCGNGEFHAHQQLYVNVIVDGNNHFLRNPAALEEGVYESSRPYGPYVCANQECKLEIEDLPGIQVKDVSNLLEEKLKLAGVGVYRNYDDWEEALEE